MSEFIVSVLILLVVGPAAFVLGVRFAWYVIKKIFQHGIEALEKWLIKNDL